MSDDVWGFVKDPETGKAPFALRITKGNEHLRTVRLEPEITYIGRMPENHVVLDDPKVSRSHARILRKGKQFFIEDQESENGVFVNGKKIQEHPLLPGAVVLIGGHKLELVRAQNDDRQAAREKQLEKAEDEEWRMDQTISGTPDQIAKLVALRKAPKASTPKMILDFTIGDKNVHQEFELTQARAKKEGDATQDQIEVRVCLGKWVMYKKIPL